MNLFLPLALIKSPGYLTEQYHVFSDEIIFEFITWNYLIGNKVEIRDPRTESFGPEPDGTGLVVRRYVVEIKEWSIMTLELIARHGSLDGYFDISRNNFDIDKSLTFLVICY